MKAYLKVVLIVILWMWSVPAKAQVTNGAAWLWADQPTETDPYVPDLLYQYNVTGNVNEVARMDTGRYAVVFKGMASTGGVVHTQATLNRARCEVGDLMTDAPSVGDLQVVINCFDTPSTGAANRVDVPFVALYYLEDVSSANNGDAYYFHSETDATLGEVHQFSGTGMPISFEQTPVRHTHDQYHVFLHGIISQNAVVLVTPFAAEGASCFALGWLPQDEGTDVGVECLDLLDGQVDRSFMISWIQNTSLGQVDGQPKLHGAYVNADQHKSENYTPTVQNNSKGGAITVQRTAWGKYLVNIPGQKINKSIIMANAYTDHNVCNATDWSDDGVGGTNINVECFVGNGLVSGDVSDTPFMLIFLTAEETGTLTSLAELPEDVTFDLSDNFPNPFTNRTTLAFEVSESSPVKLVVYDMMGRKIKVLHEGPAVGRREISFEADMLPSGLYIYQLEMSGRTIRKFMHLVK